MASDHNPTNDVALTYKFLLFLSTLTACVFCYLYVTKPTVTQASDASQSPATAENDLDDTASPEATSKPDEAANPSDFTPPSTDALPGIAATTPKQVERVDPQTKDADIDLPSSSSVTHLAWEETNDRVQHIITAQQGDQSERIILEIPVIYKTRGLRFSPAEAKEAERILRALKIYQGQIKQLHQDGLNIQSAWQTLLTGSQPMEALRADSPSLPQSDQSSPDTLSGNSADSIQLSKP